MHLLARLSGMGTKRVIVTAYLLVLIFSISECYEDVLDEELDSLGKNYAKWVQKTWTPDMFAFQGRISPPMKSDLQPSKSQISLAQQYLEDNITYHSLFDLFDLEDNITSLFDEFFSQCTRDLFYTVSNIKSEWAIRMLDSDGKLQSGLLGGNAKWPGDYKECLKVYAPQKPNSSMGNFHGRYCTATWLLTVQNFPIPLSTGLCLPDSCGGDEIMSDYENILYIIGRFPGLAKFQNLSLLAGVSCKPLEVEFDGPAIGMLFVLSVFGFLMAVGSSITIYEYFVPSKPQNFPDSSKHLNIQNHSTDAEAVNISASHVIVTNEAIVVEDNISRTDDKHILLDSDPKESKVQVKSPVNFVKSFFKCFCVLTNGAKILNTDVAEGHLLCIHGIRFLSMAWVILGHTFAFSLTSAIANLSETVEAVDTWQFQVILQGTLSVDSFFVLSGFLLTYLFLKEADRKEGKISWPFFYIHRYWRLTPVYMFALGFDAALTKYLSSGPFWSESGFEPACKEVWWRNLLYINNFGDSTKQCFGWAWYLANDMQFYVISPIFLYALWRWPKIGLSIISALMFSSWIAAGVITGKYNLIATYSEITHVTDVTNIMARMGDFFWKIYVKPYTRISPYLIGVLVGYLLYKTGNRKKFLEPAFQLLGWSIGTALTLLVIFAVYDMELSTAAAAAYNALARSAFGLSLGWVIYACLTGHGDVINRILSWKMFIPLSRLTYCAYLVHPIVIIGFFQSVQQPFYFSNFLMVILFFGLLVASYGIALITSLTFESPLMGLEKLLLKGS